MESTQILLKADDDEEGVYLIYVSNRMIKYSSFLRDLLQFIPESTVEKQEHQVIPLDFSISVLRIIYDFCDWYDSIPLDDLGSPINNLQCEDKLLYFMSQNKVDDIIDILIASDYMGISIVINIAINLISDQYTDTERNMYIRDLKDIPIHNKGDFALPTEENNQLIVKEFIHEYPFLPLETRYYFWCVREQLSMVKDGILYNRFYVDDIMKSLFIKMMPNTIINQEKRPIVAISATMMFILTHDFTLYGIYRNESFPWFSPPIKSSGNDTYTKRIGVLTQLPIDPEHILSVGCYDRYFILLTVDGVYVTGKDLYPSLFLGHRHFSSKATFKRIPFPDDVSMLSMKCGASHALFLGSDGNVYGCGKNINRELSPISDPYTQVNGIYYYCGVVAKKDLIHYDTDGDTFQFIGTGYGFSIIATNRTIYGMGKIKLLEKSSKNNKGGVDELQFPNNNYDGTPYIKKLIHFPSRILSLSVGAKFILILFDDGLWGVGVNSFGQLGFTDVQPQLDVFTPIVIPFTSPIKLVSTGTFHSVIITMNNEIYVSGLNSTHQLGMPNKNSQCGCIFGFTQVVNFPKHLIIHSVTCGDENTVITTNDGIYVSGNNESLGVVVSVGEDKKIIHHLKEFTRIF